MPRPPSPEPWPKNAFPTDNTVSIRHGIHSRRKVDPLAAELVTGLVDSRPDLDAYPETIWAWARAEARCLLLETWLSDHPVVDEDGEPAPVLRYVSQWERLASDLRTRLGLDPRSEAELVRSRADAAKGSFDLDALREKGRAIRAGA
jgi:hypothetical protein